MAPRTQKQDENHPAGRLVPVLAASEMDGHIELALALGRKAASHGETVLMLDCQQGAMMDAVGVIYHKTISDALYHGADLRDIKYVTSNEHFTAAAAGDIDLDEALGSLAALSLSYDWVFVLPPAGCTPAHVRLAAAADVGLLTFDTSGDKFMRAYWMIDAIRQREPRFDPVLLSMGPRADAVETALMLTDTVREHLGAPPPYAGHTENSAQRKALAENLIVRMKNQTKRSKVA